MSSTFPLLLSVVFSSVLEMLWYSDAFFGTTWKQALAVGTSLPRQTKQGALRRAGLNLLTAFLTSLGLWTYLKAVVTANQTLERGLPLGAMIGITAWLFFVIPSLTQGVFLERYPWSLARVHLGYRLIEFVGMGMIMVFWL